MPEAQDKSVVTSPSKEFNLIDGYYPPGVPLNAVYKLGFGFKTINQRLPVIITKIIDQLSRDKSEIEKEYGQEAREEIKTVVGALAKLKNELVTNKPIPKIGDHVWDNYLVHVANKLFQGIVENVTWYAAPWLYVECFFYHKIDASFKLSKHLKTYDPFRKQKEEGLISSINASSLLGEFVDKAEPSDVVLQTLLEVGLWGNRCDLSLSAGKNVSQEGSLVDQLQELRKSVLCDESANFWKVLKDAKSNVKGLITIGYILDNSGFELFTDFCLADKLMSVVDRVDFYVKTTPWFVSDVMKLDFHWVIEKLINSKEYPILAKLGEKWKKFVTSNRWTVVESKFWTYPHAFYEMQDADPELYKMLSQHTHLIFKGDLNYRKLIGDINWPHDTPFKEALQGFCPTPLLTLRTLKADCVAGLRKELSEEVAAKNPDWLTTGEYGILQHA